MTKYYPGIIFPYIDDLRDNETIVLAEHVNDLRLEVRAIELSLGLNPARGWNINENYQVFDTDFAFNNLHDRLEAIERAAMRDFDLYYVSRAGGSVINRTVNQTGLGIKTLAPGGVETFPALEVLKDGQDGWVDTVDNRSSIRLWGSGHIDAFSMQFGNSAGLLNDVKVKIGSSELSSSGTLSLPSTTWVSGVESSRFRSTVGQDVIGLEVRSSHAESSPIFIANASDVALFVVNGSGQAIIGGVTIDGADSRITVGEHTALGEEGLSLGENVHVTQAGLTIIGTPLTLRATTGGIYFTDADGNDIVEVSPDRIKFGLGQVTHHTLSLTSSGVWTGGPPSVSLSSNTSSLTFNKAATIQAINGLTMTIADNSKISLGAAVSEIKAGLTLNLSAGVATAKLESHVTNGSTFTVGNASLSDMRLRLNDYDVLYRVPGHTKLKSPPASHLQIGIEGQHVVGGQVLDSEFGTYVKLTASGTTLTGTLTLPDNHTTIWPSNQDAPYKVWLSTRYMQTGSAMSDLRPSYWDALLAHNSDNSPNANTEFDFYAPASGDVKITLNAELGGDVSRSAISYQILPYNDQGQLSWVPVLGCGQSHCISFNAPAIDDPGDWYYSNLSNVFMMRLEPGKKYRLQIRGQRAWPAQGDASPQPWYGSHPNYQWGYPWGRRFAVDYLRVMIEPVFTQIKVTNSV